MQLVNCAQFLSITFWLELFSAVPVADVSADIPATVLVPLVSTFLAFLALP